jgi:hypothetical protein
VIKLLHCTTIDHLIVELCQLVCICCKCLQSFSFCIVVDRRATRGNERVWAKYSIVRITSPLSCHGTDRHRGRTPHQYAKPSLKPRTPAAQRQVGTAGVLRGSERTDPRWPYLDWICLAISITYPEPCRGNQAAAIRLHPPQRTQAPPAPPSRAPRTTAGN